MLGTKSDLVFLDTGIFPHVSMSCCGGGTSSKHRIYLLCSLCRQPEVFSQPEIDGHLKVKCGIFSLCCRRRRLEGFVLFGELSHFLFYCCDKILGLNADQSLHLFSKDQSLLNGGDRTGKLANHTQEAQRASWNQGRAVNPQSPHPVTYFLQKPAPPQTLLPTWDQVHEPIGDILSQVTTGTSHLNHRIKI